MSQKTIQLSLCIALLAACTGKSEERRETDVPTPQATLPADASTTLGPANQGVRRLESNDLGGSFRADSPYKSALREGDYGSASLRFIEALSDVFSPSGEPLSFKVRSTSTDTLQLTSVRLDQTHKEIPVVGGEMLLQYSGTHLRTVVGDYEASFNGLSMTPSTTQTEAFDSAVSVVDGLEHCDRCTATLAVLRSHSVPTATPALVWQIVASVSPVNTWRLQLDAHSLELLEKQPLALNAFPRPLQ